MPRARTVLLGAGYAALAVADSVAAHRGTTTARRLRLVLKPALMPALAAAAPALAVGHAIGRIGCFLVGDDYGRPSDLPWSVAFPEGLPPTSVRVHPTQLYEAAALAVVAWALIRWRTVVRGRPSWARPRLLRTRPLRLGRGTQPGRALS